MTVVTTAAYDLRSPATVLDNHTATADPATTDDATTGYAQGSLWYNTANGMVFVCRDATATAAVWHRVAMYDVPTPAGSDQFPDHFTGDNLSSALSATAGYQPFTVSRRQAFSQLSWWQVTASGVGGLCRTALYSSTNGLPDALVANTDSGAIDVVTATGSITKVGAFTGSVTLNPGLYWGWFAYNGTGGSMTVRRFGGSSMRNLRVPVAAVGTAGGIRWLSGGSYGTPPANAPALTGSAGDFPVLFLRGA